MSDFRHKCQHTGNGRNPAPVDMENISFFIGFHGKQVVQDFLDEQYSLLFLSNYVQRLPQQKPTKITPGPRRMPLKGICWGTEPKGFFPKKPDGRLRISPRHDVQTPTIHEDVWGVPRTYP